VHGFGAGSDVKSTWLLALSIACLAVVLAAVLARVAAAWREHPQRPRPALAGAAIFSLFLVLWHPSGPLGSEWARRSGTPSALLPHTRSASTASGSQL